MKRWPVVLGTLAALALAAGYGARERLWPADGTAAQGTRPAERRPVPVEVAVATRRKVPVRVDLIGTVTPISSVAVKTRLDSEIVGVHFKDGALVHEGDLLFTLDSRAIEAQIRQLEGQLARDTASLEGAQRDVRRYTELVGKGATPVTNLDNAKTQVGIYSGALKADQASIDNLKVQLSYCTIKAPISGRVSMAAVKVGNLARAADPTPLATIIQLAPIYVTFPLPQRSLPDLRQALAQGTAQIEAVIPGDSRRATGQVTMIENTVDAATGTIAVRATMPNDDELLWPGTLLTVRLTFREEEAVTIPNVAVQASQTGSYVYVVKNKVASVQPVKVARVLDAEAVLDSGLQGGETVVTEGQHLIANGSHVAPRDAATGS